MKKILGVILVTNLLVLACTKDASPEPDILSPSIKVVYPLDIPQLPQSFPLCMKVQITDDRKLSTVWLEIDDGTGFRKDYPVTGKSLEIVEKYIAPPEKSGAFVAKFYAADESGNSAMQEIRFVLNN